MKSDKKRGKWILGTILFVLIVFGILALLLWNSFYGLLALVLSFLIMAATCVLKVCFGKNGNGWKENSNIKPLSKKQAEDSRKLLRYAVAVLSFLSLLTTANGMKSFVFGTDWMAYFASFAVQAILAVFSLLLCRFFVQVTVLAWPVCVKTLSLGLMVFFFCAALAVSSTFSYSYIVNYAYADSWTSDRETIIYTFLMEETQRLQKENNRRGGIILDAINETAREDLEGILSGLESEKEGELWEKAGKFIQAIDAESEDGDDVSIEKDSFIE